MALAIVQKSRFGFQDGDVAQLGERLNGIQKVAGSIPVISTKDLGYALGKRI